MILTRIWNFFDSLPRDPKDKSLPAVNSPEKFSAILQLERARADRYQHALSLVLFDITTPRIHPEAAGGLMDVLGRRKRTNDEVGWLDDRRIAVLLPNTTLDGARCFAEDVCRNITNNNGGPPYTIYRYPSAFFLADTDSPHPQRKKTPPDASSPSGVHSGEYNAHDLHTTFDGLQLFFPRGFPTWKRFIDVVVSLFLLLALSPLFALIAIFILIVSPGPVFYRQQRLGYMGQLFPCWKFRTMRVDAASAVHQNYLISLIHSDTPMTKLDSRSDPRIIPLGHLLRQTALDELPQLFNVLRGDMSLIGPRPCLPYEAQQYSLWHTGRFATLPGLTGLWQVSGKNRTTFREMIRFDLAYIRSQSLGLDAKILLKTFPAIIGQIKDFVSKSKEEDHEAVP